MSLIPAWAPNLHPLVVHFPIALLFAAGAADLAGLVLRHQKPMRDTATWLYIAGAAAAVAAYFTGYEAAEAMVLSAEAAALVDTHGDWAFGATWLFAFFASLRLAMSYLLRPRRALRIGAFVVALAGLGALAQTALHGARLVFEQGLGVRSVAATQEAGRAVDTGNRAARTTRGAGDPTRSAADAMPGAADATRGTAAGSASRPASAAVHDSSPSRCRIEATPARNAVAMRERQRALPPAESPRARKFRTTSMGQST